MSHRGLILFCMLPLCFAPRSTSRAADLPQNSKASANSLKVTRDADACLLPTGTDLLAAVGEALEDAKSSVESADGMQSSQCIFRVATLSSKCRNGSLRLLLERRCRTTSV